MLEPHAEALVAKMLELALAGDPVALRLCIERLIPKADQKPVVATLPDLSDLETSQIKPALLKSLAGQEISVSEIKRLMDIFTSHDEMVQKEKKQDEKLEITTKDPRACLQFIPDAYVPRLVRGIQEMVKLKQNQFNYLFN